MATTIVPVLTDAQLDWLAAHGPVALSTCGCACVLGADGMLTMGVGTEDAPAEEGVELAEDECARVGASIGGWIDGWRGAGGSGEGA